MTNVKHNLIGQLTVEQLNRTDHVLHIATSRHSHPIGVPKNDIDGWEDLDGQQVQLSATVREDGTLQGTIQPFTV